MTKIVAGRINRRILGLRVVPEPLRRVMEGPASSGVPVATELRLRLVRNVLVQAVTRGEAGRLRERIVLLGG